MSVALKKKVKKIVKAEKEILQLKRDVHIFHLYQISRKLEIYQFLKIGKGNENCIEICFLERTVKFKNLENTN